MDKDDFIKTLKTIKDYESRINDIIDLGINIVDTFIYDYISINLDNWIKAICTPDGNDFIDWWLFESGEKLLYDEEDQTEEDLEDPEDLYNYLQTHNMFK